MKYKLGILVLLLFGVIYSFAQTHGRDAFPKLILTINKNEFLKGDTVIIDVSNKHKRTFKYAKYDADTCHLITKNEKNIFVDEWGKCKGEIQLLKPNETITFKYVINKAGEYHFDLKFYPNKRYTYSKGPFFKVVD